MEKRTDINTLGEFGLIEHLTKDVMHKNPNTLLGIGDDAAVLDIGDEALLISTDLLVEGIHFDLMYTPLKHLGYKAVVVNVSDIYAMNGVAEQITVSLAISNRFSVEALEELYEGIRLACNMYNVDLVGGDTTASPQGLTISVTATGRAKKEDIVYRSGAKPGDIMCITGDLGSAYLGLQLLEREKQVYLAAPTAQPDLEEKKYIVERQLKPEAAKDAIAYFKKKKIKPTSMIDISDGLASEVFHICKASKVGAFVEEVKIPIHPEAEEMALKFSLDPTMCALNGGEDYELLFTIDEKDLQEIRYMPSVYIIGEIVDAEDGIKLHTSGGNIHDLKAQGWKHFDEKGD